MPRLGFFVGLLALAGLLIKCGPATVPYYQINSEGVKSEGRQWVQKNFFMSTFSAYPGEDANYEKITRTLLEAGFNYVETAWRAGSVTKEILKTADELGIAVMAQDLALLGGFQGKSVPYHPDSVSRFLEKYGTHPSLKSVYVSDEPIVEDFEMVRKNIDDLEQRRPDLLGFSVLLPSYYPPYGWTGYTKLRYDEYVDRYIREVKPPVLSTDYYPFQAPGDTTTERFYKSWFWKDMGLFRDRALKHDLIHWFYYQTVQIVPHNPIIQPSYVTVQAWAAILYGVKGLSTYTAAGSVVDRYGNKDRLFDVQQQLNREITALGNTLLNLKSTGVYHAEQDSIPDDYASSFSQSDWLGNLPPHLSAGEFTDGEGHTYILFLNRDFTRARNFTVPLKQTARVYLCDKKNEGRQSVLVNKADQLLLELEAGDAMLVRVENSQRKPLLIGYRVR